MEHESHERDLWKKFKESGDVEVRNMLFCFYLDWVKKISIVQFSKLNPSHISWSDSIQIGSLALLECLERFDPEIGVPFEGFAVKRVKGALINEVVKARKTEGLTKDSSFQPASGDSDFDVFVDGVLDLAFSELLDITSRKSTDSDSDPLSCYMMYREEIGIREAIGKLPDELKFVIESHYFNFLTFTQIAEILELTRARVSQIHHKALRELRINFESLT